MRYDSVMDAQTLRRASLGPVALMQRRRQPVRFPVRGLSGFGAASGAQSGISIGSSVGGTVAGPIGMAVGAILGGIGGLISDAFNRQDQENLNFTQASIMANTQGVMSVLNILNKYLVLAGLFDLEAHQIKGNIPIYKKYGRMREGVFVTDMVNVIYNAAQTGQITPNDTAQSIMARIVQPWINSFGFGAMSDSNGDMINMIIMGMIAEYVAGLQTRWFARGGDYPFKSLPLFSLPGYAPPGSGSAPAAIPTSAAPAAPPVATQSPELQSYLAGLTPLGGATINYAKGTDGKFLRVPPGGTFEGIDPATGAWIVQYATGVYTVTQGSLVSYAPHSQAPLAAPAAMPVPTQTPVIDPGYSMPTSSSQPVYVPTGGGGGGWLAPSAAAVPALTATSGMSTQDMLLIGGGVLVLALLLMRRPSAGAL